MFDVALIGVFVLFLFLALGGVGFPLPEEIALLLAGVYAALTGLWWPVVLSAVLGIAASDTLAYARGRFHAAQFSKFKKGAKFITKNGVLAVMLSRVFIATRAIVPYMAGAMRMSRVQFHGASLIGAVVSALLLVTFAKFAYAALPTATAPLIALPILAVLTAYLVRAGARAHLQLLDDAQHEEHR